MNSLSGSATYNANDTVVLRPREVCSAFFFEIRPIERLVRQTPLVALGEHRCPSSHVLFSGGGPQTVPFIGFMRTSVIRTFDDSRSEVHTPNVAGFHNIGSWYERRAIDDLGDNSDWIVVSPPLLAELTDSVGAEKFGRDSRLFSRPFAPLAANSYIAQRHLFDVLNSDGGSSLSDLAVEEYTLHLVRAILWGAAQFWGTRPSKRKSRPTCERKRKSVVEAIKQKIATEYWSNQSLVTLARAVHSSPGQLARIFPIHTGFSIHSYQEQIRLRVSLELLRESPFEISDVATQLGFSNHSHFSTVFRRRFGISPSQFAKSRSRGLARSFIDSLDQSFMLGASSKCKRSQRLSWLL